MGVLLCACVKKSTISGIITDKATGLPIGGVQVGISAIKYESENDKVTSNSLGEDSQLTGPDGRYFLEIDTKRPDDFYFGASKAGYVHRSITLSWGKERTYDFELNPIDAVIRVTVSNESGSTAKTYALINSSAGPNFGYIYPWPFVLQQNESFVSTFNVCGGSFTEIRWGNQPNQPLKRFEGVQRDSVFCPRGDTTDYLLRL